MCTATYIPLEDQCLFGANRDEHVSRENALPPQISKTSDCKALYPVDGEKGGTWVGVLGNGMIACLLNGAFEAYKPRPPYRKSRGYLILELFEHGALQPFVEQTNLIDIEPFTLVMIPPNRSGQNLCELRWDGEHKYVRYLDPGKIHLWASASLNSKSLVAKKQHWFREWLQASPHPDLKTLLKFHQQTDPRKPADGIRMKRNNGVQTVSTTLIQREARMAKMFYQDLRKNFTKTRQLPLKCAQY